MRMQSTLPGPTGPHPVDAGAIDLTYRVQQLLQDVDATDHLVGIVQSLDLHTEYFAAKLTGGEATAARRSVGMLVRALEANNIHLQGQMITDPDAELPEVQLPDDDQLGLGF